MQLPGETLTVRMRMKHRWTGGLALATALMLGACAPTQQGADESDAPSQAAERSAPATTESTEASGSAAPTPYDY